ncbi:MAG: SIR2 family NAD-dependent protein deacylase [Bacteroidota bacterium]
MQKVVVLTGAGMSADSGLATFRDSGGLWEGFDIQEVASVTGWEKNPEKVLEFYNKRRAQLYEVEPNEGHKALVQLEEQYDVTIITQNVDNLHERAGSSDVVHLHGELAKARSVKDDSVVIDIGDQPIKLGDKAPDGEQLRPHVVWFGEMVPMMEQAAQIVPQADIFIVIGTSLVVYPAAGLTDLVRSNTDRFVIDPKEPEIREYDQWEHYKKTAEEGTPELVRRLLK